MAGQSARAEKAREYAHQLDKQLFLDPHHTVPNLIKEPDRDVFVHLNKMQRTSEILLEEEQDSAQRMALRVFFESFYGKLGYIPKYRRGSSYSDAGMSNIPSSAIVPGYELPPGVSVENSVVRDIYFPPPPESIPIHEPAKFIKTCEEDGYPSRETFVMDNVELIGISEDDVKYLAGKRLWFKDLNEAHHRVKVRVAAIHLERQLQSSQYEERREAYLKVWTFLTGYGVFEEAYLNDRETRWLSDFGVEEDEEFMSESNKYLGELARRQALASRR
jgi:hypothetical protein